MAIVVKGRGYESTTNMETKNRWATTWQCFYDAQALYGKPFQLDVAAEPATAKCDRFYVSIAWWNSQVDRTRIPHITAANNRIVGFDALQGNWENDWWCNPPFDQKLAFIAKADEQARKGKSGMMLIPYEPCTQWFLTNVMTTATIVYEPDGRYQFYEYDGVTKKSGANFPCCLVLFTPHQVNGTAFKVPFIRGIG